MASHTSRTAGPGPDMALLSGGRIRHSVVFTLMHPADSKREREFLEATAALAEIGGVEAFELMAETSPKNGFRFALTMEFAGDDAYQAYNQSPAHVAFVSSRWDAEVSDFLEIDTVALPGTGAGV